MDINIFFENIRSSIDFQELINQLFYDEKNPLLFNNGFFVYFFFLFMVLYYCLRKNNQAQRLVFCLFSLYFFYKASGNFVVLVIVSAVVDYFLSNAIYKCQNNFYRKSLLGVSVFFNLGLLFFFKYTNFFIQISNDILSSHFHPLNIILPIGISFYTFENLSYTIDVYRKQFEPVKKFSEYLLFLSFFPKLMMGPIVRANDFMPQISKKYQVSEKAFMKGFYLIMTGFIKKLVISDYISLNFVNYVFDNPGLHTGLENLLATYAYAIVIYCDFSGYSDVAIGIALWLGFTIPPNFSSPYQSQNISEFWRRWHISLSSWLKDYLYIPLGGNKTSSLASYFFVLLFLFGSYFFLNQILHLSEIISGGVVLFLISVFVVLPIISKNKQGVSANFNLLTTMLLGGFWHGASWNFIIWGAFHGIALGLHKIWCLFMGSHRSLKAVSHSVIYNFISIVLCFHFVCFCWVFFKASDLNTAFNMLHQITYNFNFDDWQELFKNYDRVFIMVLLGFIAHYIPDSFADRLITKTSRLPLIISVFVFFGFLLLYSYFKSAEQVMPIYLQF